MWVLGFETSKGCGNTKFGQGASSLNTREATSVLVTRNCRCFVSRFKLLHVGDNRCFVSRFKPLHGGDNRRERFRSLYKFKPASMERSDRENELLRRLLGLTREQFTAWQAARAAGSATTATAAAAAAGTWNDEAFGK